LRYVHGHLILCTERVERIANDEAEHANGTSWNEC
jgi:hypothetical protein